VSKSSTIWTPPTRAVGFANGFRRSAGLSTNAHYENDPKGWINNVVKNHLWSKQIEIAHSVRDNRYTAVQSAHDTGKSFSLARLAAWWIDVKPDPFVVTTAPTWKQVNAILWREMRKAHRTGKLRGRINMDAEWYMGTDELVGFGRKPADYDQAAFQGIHALNVLVLIDEACGVPQSLFEAADSLATNHRARVVAIGNPDDPASYFQTVCAPGSGWNNITISAFDTPAFTGEEVPQDLLEYLVSPLWVEERKKRWGVRSPTYISKVLGKFPDITDDTLLTPRMLREAQMRSIVPSYRDDPSYGFDISRFGDAQSAAARNLGGYVRITHTWEMAATTRSADMITKILNEEDDWGEGSYANIDVIGLGAGVYDQCDGTRLPVIPHNGSERPNDPERFFNKRAEDYWHLREMAEAELLDLPEQGEDDDLIAQLGSIKWKVMPGGKIAIESKEDMKKRGLPSPDKADAVMMACAQGLNIFVPSTMSRDDTSLTNDLLDRAM
jgi:hypothetical protein